jgi:hypothetical protein
MRVTCEGFLVALAMGLFVCAAACGSAPRVGDVIMTVTVPEGVQVQSVQYTMDDQVNAPSSGIVGGMQPERQFVQFIPHVPVNDQYMATFQAESVDGQMACSASAVIKVMDGVTTRVDVALKCGGHVVVAIGVSCNDTPLVDFLVSPIVATVGTSVIGSGASARPDGGPLTYAWSVESGSFVDGGAGGIADGGLGTVDDATASQINFTCTKTGPVTVSLKVEDDELCWQSYSSTVTCLPPVDGGVGDAGPTDARRD